MGPLKDTICVGSATDERIKAFASGALKLDVATLELVEDLVKELRNKYDTHRDIEPPENDYYIDAFLQVEVRLNLLLTIAKTQ